MISAFADAVRGAHYASIILLFGCFIFQLAVAEPALRTARAGAAERRQLEGFLRSVAAASLLSGLLTGIVWLWLNAADMSGETLGAAFSWQLFGTVLGDTGFGVLWQFRGAVAILLGALLAIPLLVRPTDQTPAARLAFTSAGALLSGIILASLALAGHGAGDSGTARSWHLGADLLHLLAAGGWLGSLPPLVFVLWQAREPGGFIQLRIAQAATSRFSTLGLVTVTTLVVTGSINTWYLAGSVPALVGTPYGRVLLIKLALFAGMLTLAAVNRLKLTPLLLALPAEPMPPGPTPAEPMGAPDPVRRLNRSAAMETGLAVLLLLAVGSLVHLIPGAHSDAVWPFPITVDIDGVTDLSGARLALLAAALCSTLGLVVAAISLRRWRWRFAAASIAAVAAIGVFGLGPFVIAAFPTSYAHSPVHYGSLPIARGMSLYTDNCVACHGPYGYGDGPAAGSLAVRPADLTRAHFYHHGEGTLFWWVSHGVAGSPMPGFADQLSETQRWDVIAFLRAQADAERAKFMAADVEPRGPVIAPDFAFQIGNAPQETLTRQRNRFVVLLVLFQDAGSLPRLRELDAATAQFERARVRVIALRMAKDAKASDHPDPAPSLLSIAETDPETITAYSLFRRTLSVEGVPVMPAHMEFLIDRQGYLRYRWSPAYDTRWHRMTDLIKRIESLNQEPQRPPAAEAHAH
jgi:putative copper export protein/mono/diheme cytochrome c family protein